MKKNKLKWSLGALEAEIMDIVWSNSNVSVREVVEKLRKKKKIAYTTVMTVMLRLSNKKILKRKQGQDGAYIYWPSQNRDDFAASVSRRAINDLIKSFGEVAVAQFIDVVETSDLKNLENWRLKLKKIK
ncbi:MAG: BlaI/MecI/CopY family transcriptional regulator [Candidatus Doudnabacteria bacterium]